VLFHPQQQRAAKHALSGVAALMGDAVYALPT
jgi:hypothetical protein